MRGDIQAVESYGSSHPDTWAGVAFGGPDGGRVVAYFTDDVAQHRESLEVLVTHPDRLDVVRACYSLAYLQEVHEEIDRLASPGQIRSLSYGFLVVDADVSPAALDLAEELVERFGSAVRITVGGRPFPPGEGGGQESPPIPLCEQASARLAEAGSVQGLEMSISLDSSPTPSGSTFSGTLTLRNTLDEVVELNATGTRSALLVRAGALEVVGYYDGPMTMEAGPFVSLVPGATDELPITGGTTPCDGSEGYTLPPGDYEVAVLVVRVTPSGSESILVPPAPLELG